MKRRSRPAVARFHVYVIELGEGAREDAKFAAANPDARADKPCLYVGMTGLSPEARFERHRRGIQSARLVKKFGVRLRPRLYERFNPLTYDAAVRMEVELARRLRRRGFGVWQR